MRNTTLLAVPVMLAVLAILIPLGAFVLQILGGEPARAADDVFVLAVIGQAKYGAVFWHSNVLMASGHVRILSRVMLAAGVLQVAVVFALAPSMGATGAAVGYLAANVFINGVLGVLAVRALRQGRRTAAAAVIRRREWRRKWCTVTVDCMEIVDAAARAEWETRLRAHLQHYYGDQLGLDPRAIEQGIEKRIALSRGREFAKLLEEEVGLRGKRLLDVGSGRPPSVLVPRVRRRGPRGRARPGGGGDLPPAHTQRRPRGHRRRGRRRGAPVPGRCVGRRHLPAGAGTRP